MTMTLIERICAAEAGSRELDAEIMSAIGYVREERHIGAYYDNNEPALDWVYVDPATSDWVSTHPPSYTTSVDAALSLVPEGSSVDLTIDPGGLSEVAVTFPDDVACAAASTPALAICAAAIQARSA